MKKHTRKSWDDYFLDVAKLISTRATCDRLYVGAVIVKDNRILATGYNGSLPKAPHCNDVGHLIINDHCKRTTHAEMNAIAQAAANGIAISKSHIYITHAPCTDCFRMIVASGIERITFKDYYKLDEKAVRLYNSIVGEIDNEPNWSIHLTSNVWYKI